MASIYLSGARSELTIVIAEPDERVGRTQLNLGTGVLLIIKDCGTRHWKMFADSQLMTLIGWAEIILVQAADNYGFRAEFDWLAHHTARMRNGLLIQTSDANQDIWSMIINDFSDEGVIVKYCVDTDTKEGTSRRMSFSGGCRI